MIRRIKPIVLAGWALLAVAAVCVFLSLRPTFLASANPSVHIPARSTQPGTAREKSLRHPPSVIVDPAAQLARYRTAGNVIGMQTVVREWFASDPEAVRDWMGSQKSLKSLQPALIQIAKDVTDSGSPADALKWAELMENGPEREQTLFEIYAYGRRYHSLSEDEIRAAPFPPARIADLISGAGDD